MISCYRGTMMRRRVVLLAATGSMLAGSALAQVDTTFTASQTIGNVFTAPLTIDATANVVNITQNTGTTIRLADGGLLKLGSFTASISGGKITSDIDEVDIDSTGGDFTINSALNGISLALLKLGTGRVILGSTDSTNHNFGGGVFLNEGALQISSDANLGANSGNANFVSFNGGTLEVAANVNFSSTRTFNVGVAGGTFAVTGTSFVATIDDTNQITGSGHLIKEGAGTVRITSSNVLAGSVSVNAGIVELRNTAALSGPSSTKAPITLNAGGQLNLRHDGPFPGNFGNNITVAGNSTIDINQISTGSSGSLQLGALNLGNATLTVTGANRSLQFNGTTVVAGDATVDNSVDVRLGGQLTGNGSLTKRGVGVLALSGIAPNTYANLTTVLGGTLELGKTAGADAIPGDLIIDGGTVKLVTPGQISDFSNVMVTTGRLDVNNQTDTVNTLVNDGGAIATGTGSLIISDSGSPGGLPGSIPGLGPPMASGGGGLVRLASGTTVINSGGRLEGVSMIVSGGLNRAQANGIISVGTAGLTMQGEASPTLALEAAATVPGMMQIRSNVSFTGTNGTAAITSEGAFAQSGILDLSGAVRTFTVNDGAAPVDMLISARVQSGGLMKSGAGILRLSHSNSYAGGTSLANGTLEITDSAALGTGSVVFLGGALSLRSDAPVASFATPLSAAANNSIALEISRLTPGAPGLFQIPGGTLGSSFTVNAPAGGALNFTGPVFLAGATNIVANTPITISATVAQAGGGMLGITKTGTSTLTLAGSANNSYIGPTNVNEGVLLLAKTSGIALPTNVVINGTGQVKLAGSEQIADTARVTLSGGTLDLAGLSETVSHLTGSGTVILGSGTLTIASGGTESFTGLINGSGRVNKSGDAQFILAGSNAFTGGSTVSGGTLTYQNPSANHVGNTLTGGVWRVSGESTLEFATGNIQTNQANVTLSGGSSTFLAINALATNSGTFAVTDGRAFATLGGLNNTGALVVGGGTPGSVLTINGAITQLPGSTLTGGTWIARAGGNLQFNAAGPITTNAGSVTLDGLGSLFTAINSIATNQGRFTVTGGRTFITAGAISNTGTITVGDDSLVKFTAALTNTGTLDINGGAILEYNAGQSPITTVRSQLQTGFTNGNWTGPGIHSTLAALEQSTPGGFATAIGYGESLALGFNNFLNEGVDETALILAYTYSADATLDGKVNTLDFNKLALNFNQTNRVWTQGDFNYDGLVNALDFNALASNFGATMTLPAGLLASSISMSGLLVPEPGSTITAVCGLLALSTRRRRNPSGF